VPVLLGHIAIEWTYLSGSTLGVEVLILRHARCR
jgi:hypothetical protein